MKITRRISAAVLSLILMLTMMPAIAFAEDAEVPEEAAMEASVAEDAEDAVQPEEGDASMEDPAVTEAEVFDEEEIVEEFDDETGADAPAEGYAELTYSQGVDSDAVEGPDAEELFEDYMLEEEPDANKQVVPLAKGPRLNGTDFKYYNYYCSIIKSVTAGKLTTAAKKVKVGSFAGKRTFTAKELGVSRIGYIKNGEWHVTDKAMKKISELVYPQDLTKVWFTVMTDMTSSGYWVDWYGGHTIYKAKTPFNYTTNRITFKTTGWIQFRIPVIAEFRGSSLYKTDSKLISGANKARKNAKELVKAVAEDIKVQYPDAKGIQVDYLKLLYYGASIAELSQYDHDAAALDNPYWKGPWSLISVFDFDESTKVVCAGYARAYKYLCDLSKFNSNWIDCQIATGSAGAKDSNHMWNIVRMNDGLNYVVDPTWMDTDDDDIFKDNWFLRGDPDGTANSFTIEGNHRVYDDRARGALAPAERKLAEKYYYDFPSSRAIKLRKPTIKTPARGKRSITVKWKKVTSPLGALYVDGYQIRYSSKKSMSGAKKVTVKGYNKASKTIKKLKAYKYYYVQVRTYAKMGSRTYYSPWSAKKKVKTK